jgi:hypothetical protein
MRTQCRFCARRADAAEKLSKAIEVVVCNLVHEVVRPSETGRIAVHKARRLPKEDRPRCVLAAQGYRVQMIEAVLAANGYPRVPMTVTRSRESKSPTAKETCHHPCQ